MNLHLAPGIEKDNLKRCGRQALARSLASRFAPPYSASVQAGSSSANLTHFSVLGAAHARSLRVKARIIIAWMDHSWMPDRPTDRQRDREKKPHQIGRAPPSSPAPSFPGHQFSIRVVKGRRRREEGMMKTCQLKIKLCYVMGSSGRAATSVSQAQRSTLPSFPQRCRSLSYDQRVGNPSRLSKTRTASLTELITVRIRYQCSSFSGVACGANFKELSQHEYIFVHVVRSRWRCVSPACTMNSDRNDDNANL